MQNNFNFLSQLQSAASNNMTTPASQDNPGQSLSWSNAALMGAMQNMLSRGSSSLPLNLPGNVLGSMPGGFPGALSGAGQQQRPSKPPAPSEVSPDMSVFRQFQLPQNPSLPAVGTMPAGKLGATATSSIQAPSGTWNSPVQAGQTTGWVNPLLTPATGEGGSTAPGPGTVGNFPAQGMNNPFLNAMFQAMLTQMAMQAQPANPMAGFMQMMQTAMSFAGMMPSQTPSMDPNLAKQLLVQLVGQLQQSGQLPDDDSVQHLLQQVGSSNNLTAEVTSNAPNTHPVISIQPDEGVDTLKEEHKEEAPDDPLPVTVSAKKTGKGKKGKAVSDPVLPNTLSKPKASRIKGSSSKSSPEAGFKEAGKSTISSKPVPVQVASFDDDVGMNSEGSETEVGKRNMRNYPEKSGASVVIGGTSLGQKFETPKRKSVEGKRKIVMIDSDGGSDDNDSPDTASEASGITEGSKGKKGKGPAKRPSKDKKPNKDTPRGNQKGKKDVPVPVDERLSFPEPVRRIKIEDTSDDYPSESIPLHGHSPRASKNLPVMKSAEREMPILSRIKLEEDTDVKPFPIPSGIRTCEVRLPKLKRDASGKFIVPHNNKSTSVSETKAASFTAEMPKRTPSKADLSGGRRGSPGAAREDPTNPSTGMKLLPNVNGVVCPQMRTLFVGHLRGKMQWLSLIGWAESHCFCQCAFCPILSDTPKAILTHIRSEHQDLTFALTRMKPPTGKYLYLLCRHCDFVAYDVTINWLHFEVYHNISDILEGTARPRTDDFAPPKLEIRRGLNDIMESQQSYMCYDCELISDDSKELAIHVLQQHLNTVHYNGCFVKLLGIRRPLKSENVPYRRIISDDEFDEFRQEAFICMMCDYIAHCPYMALSHNLITHQTKRVLFECMVLGCSFSCMNENTMMQHLSSRHKLKTDLCCSTTLLEPSLNGFTECAITVNRKASKQALLQRCGVPGSAGINGNARQISPVTNDEESNEENDSETGENDGTGPKMKDRVSSGQSAAVNSSLDDESRGKNRSLKSDDVEEDYKIPDDFQITINPPSPDEQNGSPNSPASDDSNDTIVDDVPYEGEGAAAVEKENIESTKPNEMESSEVVGVDSSDGKALEQPNKPSREPEMAENEGKDPGTGDFMSEILSEPCCLTPDIYLPVPIADICTFDTIAEGAARQDKVASEPPCEMDTTEKAFP